MQRDELRVISRDELHRSSRLKSGQIGSFGLAALAIGVVSPALGLFALWGPMQTAAGPITPLVFVGAALLALPTAVSYSILNREAPSAGAASTWLWRTISPSVGYVIGLIMLTYFALVVCTMPVLFGVFFRDMLQFLHLPDFGVTTLIVAIPIVTLPVMWAAYRGAEASTRAAAILMAIECGVVMALSATILHAHRNLPGAAFGEPFNLHHASHGFTGYWAALLLGILSYCGFDVVSTAAEETNAPRRLVPRAIMITVAGTTAFWVLNAWAFSLGFPHGRIIGDSSGQELSAVSLLARKYWGDGSILIILCAFTGIFAVYITSALGTSRITFALARHGLLPERLTRLRGSKRVPTDALHAVFGFAITLDAVLTLALRNGVAAFTWLANAVVFFATITFVSVNIANIVWFRRILPDKFNWFLNGAVPLTGACLSAYVLYESFFVTLWTSHLTGGRSLVVLSILVVLTYIAGAGVIAANAPHRLRGEPPIGAEQ
jgi:basic amino acid/polyamine antiporter, APA family